MLFLDGVYVDHPNGIARFRWVKAPTNQAEQWQQEQNV
jgi:hypothetical protein